MHKKKLKWTAKMIVLTMIATLLMVPMAHASPNAPLLASAQGTAWGIGTSNENAVIHLQVQNLYLDPSRNNTISPWVLEFDFEGDIQAVTNAVVASKTGDHYVLKGSTSTALAYGETLSLRLETTLNGKVSATFSNLILRPEVIARSWEWLAAYNVNDIVEYNGHYYKAIQAHTAYAPNWDPVQAPALWQPTTIETYSYHTSVDVDLEVVQTWELLSTYTAGQLVYYEGAFYRCVQTHTAYAPNWHPGPETESLWKKVQFELPF